MRKNYVGGAIGTTLTADISDVATTIPMFASGGWPTGSVAPFVLQLVRASDGYVEKVLCASRTGNDITVTTRGYDGTTAASFSIGDKIQHVLDAVFVDAANAYVEVGHLPLAGGVMTGALQMFGGTAELPGAAFVGDTDTGISSTTANTMGFSTAGFLRLQIDSAGVVEVIGPSLRIGNGNPAVPSLALLAEPGTGFFRHSANSIGLANNGATTMVFAPTVTYFYPANGVAGFSSWHSNANFGLAANTVLQLSLRATVGKHAYITFTEDTFSDKWAVGIDAGSLNLNYYTYDGASRILKAYLSTAGNFYVSNGTTAAPGLSFLNDTAVGLYSITANAFGSTGVFAERHIYNGGDASGGTYQINFNTSKANSIYYGMAENSTFAFTFPNLQALGAGYFRFYTRAGLGAVRTATFTGVTQWMNNQTNAIAMHSGGTTSSGYPAGALVELWVQAGSAGGQIVIGKINPVG